MAPEPADSLSGRDAFFSHLQWWAYDHGLRSRFRGYISPSTKKPSYQLGQPVRCLIRPIDTAELSDVLVKLTRRRDAKNRVTYSMVLSDFGIEWVGEKLWFDSLATAQTQREAGGSSAAKRAPAEAVKIWQHTKANGPKVPQNRDSADRLWVIIRPPFPFLRLPLELRLQIIDHYLGHGGNVYLNRDTRFDFKGNPYEQDPLSRTLGLSPILRINHKIYNDIARHFYTTATFHLETLGSLKIFLQQLHPEHRLALRSLTLHLSREAYIWFSKKADLFQQVSETSTGTSGSKTLTMLRELRIIKFTIYYETVPGREFELELDENRAFVRCTNENFFDDYYYLEFALPKYSSLRRPLAQHDFAQSNESVKFAMAHVPKINIIAVWYGFPPEQLIKTQKERVEQGKPAAWLTAIINRITMAPAADAAT